MKPCGGTVPEDSKSSGALRLTPITEDGSSVVRSRVRGWSGVWILKTGVDANRLSGVFGRRVVVGRDILCSIDGLGTEVLSGLSARAEAVVPLDKRDNRRQLLCVCNSCISKVCEGG